MSYLFAIDKGNFAIKTPNFIFPSGLMELPGKETITKIDIIEFGNSIFALSSERLPYMRDKTTTDSFFVLSLFAIAKEMEYLGIDSPIEEIDLAVGLPPEHYTQQKQSMTEYYSRGKVNFVYNDRPISLIIRNIYVYPQAYAAVAAQTQQIMEIPRVFVVDIGGYTTDVLLMEDGKPILNFVHSIEYGTIHMYNLIQTQINAKYNLRIDDSHIRALLNSKRTVLSDEVKSFVLKTVEQYASTILYKLRELHIDLRANPSIFIGGGSVLYKPYLEKSSLVVQPKFELNPHANAIGYHLLAARKIQNTTGRMPQNITPFRVQTIGGVSGEDI